jgi:hypothetical protein
MGSLVDTVSSVAPDLGFGGGANSDFLSILGNNPAGQIDILQGDSIFGEFGQFAADPLDLFGQRAQQTSDRINQILEESAAAGIALNEAQIAEITKLAEPFTTAATQTALPSLSNLALGGDIDFQTSPLAKRQLETGRESIVENRAAGGKLKSSGTFKNLADLASRVASEDIGRFEGGQTALLNAGIGAEQGLRSAGTQVSGNISDLLTNLSSGVGATSSNLANKQLQSGQAGSDIAGSIGSLIIANQGG